MAGSIDDKVVSMSFENGRFESGVSRTLSSLEKLKQALHFPGASKGLSDINAAAGRVNLAHIGNAVDGIKSKFSALSVIGITALATLASRAVSAGAQLVKSLTLGPVIQGFQEYETKLSSVQTILSNTASAGTNLKDVNAALAELNTYADKTIYNFGEMTRNIGTFTAAGVDLKTSVASIKGIANLAALSGSNSQQASTAMYQLSQAISAGRVNLQDWNSVVNAGMGGTIFQRALAQTAVHMGVLDKNAVQLKGSMKNVTVEGKSFRESIMAKPGQQSWLTGEVLTKTLSQLSGNLTDAQLKAEGYTDAEIKAIQTQARQALEAATQVKTLSQLLDTTKEAIGSGWADTWQLIFGDFGEAKTLFTGLSNAIGGFVSKSANARNSVLKDWKQLGGRTLLLQGLKQFFQNLGDIMAPIKEAFRDIFPAKTGQDLYNLTQRFEQFTEKLKPAPETVANLHRTFRGFFAALDIGKQIIGGIGTVFKTMFGAVTDGSGGFLNFTGSIGDFIVKIDEALKSGGKLHNFFVTLGTVLSKPIQFLSQVAGAIGDLFSGFDPGGIVGIFAGITGSLSPMQKVLSVVAKAWNNLIDSMGGSDKILKPLMQGFGDFFSGLGDFISNAVANINWDAVLETIKVGLLGGLVLIFRNFFKGANIADLGGGVLDKITGPFQALTGVFKSMQTQIRAKALLEIAIAIGILAASLIGLSTVDPQKLNNALSGLAIAFGELLGAMAIMDKIGKNAGFLKLPFIASSLIILATAVGILVLSVKALSNLSWNDLVKGLTGVGTLLVGISLASGPLSRNSAGLISAGAGITVIAIAMKILASAVADFGGLSWTALAKGISSIAVALGAIAVASRAFPTGMVAIGVGLIGVATGLKILASAVGQFGKMNIGTLAKGIGSVGAALAILAGGMRLMPPGMAAQAAGLILVALALQGIARAVQSFGGMSLTEIAKGVGALGGSISILAVGLRAMTGSLAGAAALTVASVGLVGLSVALQRMGSQSWGQIAKGMIGLGAAMAILAAAGILLAPVAPALMALGVAMLAIGAGMALAGAGIMAVGIGLSAIAVAGPTAVGILISALTQLISKIPQAVLAFAQGLVGFVTAIGAAAPKMVAAFANILIALLNAVIIAAPKIAQAFTVLLNQALTVLQNNFPRIVQVGFQMLVSLLNGIRNNIGRVTTMAIDIVIRFLNTIAGRIGQIVTAGFNVLINFLRGIANNIGRVVTAGADIIVRLLNGIANNVGRVITAGANIVISFVTGIINNLGRLVTSGATAVVKFLDGVTNNIGRIIASGTNAAVQFITAIGRELPKLVNAGMVAVINFLNGVAAAIRAHSGEMGAAGANIATAIVEGMVRGLLAGAGRVASAAGSLVTHIPGKILSLMGIGSPSKVMIQIGGYIVDGLVIGMTNGIPGATAAVTLLSNSVINGFKSVFGIASPSKTMMELGQYIGDGFAQGLLGSKDQIVQVFGDMTQKIKDAVYTTQQEIAASEERLKSLLSEKKKDWGEITKTRQALKAEKDLLVSLGQANTLLASGLTSQKNQLKGLADQYDLLSERLKEANSDLNAAIQTRDQAISSFTEQYTGLPSLTDKEGNVVGYEAYLQKLGDQITATRTYAATLDQLRVLGLDDATYQKLLQEGPADQAFANQLLAGGATAVQGLNALDAQLLTVSKGLATNSAYYLYQAGVQAKQGIVDGLTRDMTALRKAMERIATAMIKALKKKLKIKSPSEEFQDLGVNMIQGLAVGLNNTMNDAISAVDKMGDKLIKSVNGISDQFGKIADISPVLTPVLDLSNIQSGATEMSRLLNVVPISAAASYGQAASIFIPGAEEPGTSTQPAAAIHFEQNNYSPEALSPVEIYRQTRNQLSLAKSALSLS